MTKEERDEKKRLREIEKERKTKEFPGAILSFERSLDDGAIQIRMEDGDDTWIVLRKHKSAKWYDDEIPGYERVSLHLRFYIPALAPFIRALVVRYNAIAKDINSEASAIPRMEPLAIIDIENPPEVTA